MQCLPDVQTLPHAPQLSSSVAKLTHTVPHLLSVSGQPVAHFPPLQTSPAAQLVPQPPQFCTSVAVFTHWPLQSFVPAGHEQLDAVHVAPPTQATPHAPQLEPSVTVSTHAPLHTVSGGSHCVWQWPVWQTEPDPQTVLQVPQLLELLWVSTQAPLQRDCPTRQVHVLLTQLAPLPHASPHPPQFFGSEAVKTHDPLQLTSPEVHCAHCPPLHDWEEPHALAQAPQLA